MYTDQEIRTAMDGLVKQKGENHIGNPRYASAYTGLGDCFLGALCEFMHLPLPYEGQNARLVLGKGNISERMQDAFALAQYLNDQRFKWKYVLMGVDEVLAGNLVKTSPACPCGCEVSDGYKVIIDKIKAKREFDRTRELPKVSKMPASLGLSNGGLIKTAFTLDGMTGSVYSLNASMPSFTNSFLQEGVVLKKDHALVA